MTQLTGLVLAGGAGSRMGQDKATLTVAGQRLVERAVQCLAECCVEVLVAAGSKRPLHVTGARTIADAPGEGPLAGIVAGLQQARTPLLAVVAVDMPDVNADIFVAMATFWDGEAGVLAQVGGLLQPLHALYATAWAPRYAKLLATGENSPRQALHTLGARVVDDDVWQAVDPAAAFARSLNSPGDLSAYRRREPSPPCG